MKKLIVLLFLGCCSSAPLYADARSDIMEVMDCFFKWDKFGGEETGKKCISEKVLYHRVDSNGEHMTNTPPLDFRGKGNESYEHNLLDIDVFDNMATVRALIRYNPQSADNTYMKTYVLYRVNAGWRVTNVFWGRVTAEH